MPFNNYFTGAGLDAIKQDFIVYQGTVLPTNTSVFNPGDVFYVQNDQKWYRWNGANWVQLDGSALANVALTSQSNTFASSQTIQGDLTVVDISASAVSGSRLDFVSGSIDSVSGSSLSYTSGTVVTLSSTNAAITNVSGSRLDYVSGDIASASVDRLQFDTSASVVPNVGELVWNDTAKTVDVNLNNQVTLQVGQESLVRARNDTGVTIPNGSVVYVTGALGNRPTIGLACANNGAACSGKILGLTTQAIANNADGFVTTEGTVRELNTSVDGDGVTLQAGDALYASLTPGEWVKTPPSSPDRQALLGYVTRVNPAEGQVFVRVDNGRTLEELHDVETSAPADGDVIVYDSSQSVWLSQSQSQLTVSSSQVSDFVSATQAVVTKTYVDGLNVDADTLDSLDSTQFVRSDQSGSISGSLTITDDLTLSSTSLLQFDSVPAIDYSTVNNYFIFSPARDVRLGGVNVPQWSPTFGTTYDIWTENNDGSGSGLDADLLDGQEGSYYVDFTNATNLPDPTLTITGDVTGSTTFTDLGSASLNASVTEGAVTQHEAALTVTESQVSDLDKYTQAQVDAKDDAVEAAAVAFAIALG